MNQRFLVGIVLLGFLAAQLSFGDTYAEVPDAGQLLGTAQNASGGANPLTAITGTVGSTSDVDMFKILITGAFSANTFGTEALVGFLFDPELWLFDAVGSLIYVNDDCGVAPSGLNACVPYPFPGTLALAPGSYNLAISRCCKFPLYDGSGHLSGWAINGIFSGDYIINLSGAEFVNPVPEPGTLLLLTSGLLAAYRRKKLRPKPSS